MTEKVKNLKGRVVIENRSTGPKYERQFFLDIQEKILEGYRIAENFDNSDVSMRNYRGFLGRAVLYKDGVEEVEKEVTKAPEAAPEVKTDEVVEEAEVKAEESPEESEVTYDAEHLKSLTKKKQVLDYAKKLGVEIPDDVNAPPAIKKIIKEKFE